MAAAPIKVAVIGATGRTGESIVNGLLASDIKYVSIGPTLHTQITDIKGRRGDPKREEGERGPNPLLTTGRLP